MFAKAVVVTRLSFDHPVEKQHETAAFRPLRSVLIDQALIDTAKGYRIRH